MKKVLILVFLGLVMVVGLAAMVIKPVPVLPEEELAVVNGRITQVLEAGTHDIVFKLKNGDQYYINRGTEKGLDVDELKMQLKGQMVTIKYPDVKRLIPTKAQHLSKLEFQGKSIYSEVD